MPIAILWLFVCVAILSPLAIAGEPRGKIPVKVDLSSRDARTATVQRLRKQSDQRRTEAEAFATAKNWPIKGQRDDGVEFELFAVIDGRPYYRKTEGTNAAITTGANLIRQTAPYNLDGAGWTVGMWDAGLPRPTHQEFGSPTRISSPDGTTSTSGHSTIVGSIIGASGVSAIAQGMAPAVTLHCYNTSNDRAELAGVAAATAGQAGKIFLSNFSLGFAAGWARSTAGPGTGNPSAWHWFDTWGDLADDSFGQYSTFTREFDEICYNAPYHLVFKSAGNEQLDSPSSGETIWYRNASNDWVSKVYDPGTDPLGDGDYENGYDTLPTDKAAKNLVVVGAVNDAVTTGVRDPSKATLYNRSSWGPTDDGRIKPDIVANGVAINAASSSSDTSYSISTTTSFAAANATGSAILLNELYFEQTSGEYMRSSTLRGLIIHTATDIGNPGPDYQNGWGLMNVKDAADLILADLATPADNHIVEATLNAGNPSDTYTLNSNGTAPLKVTICWTDPPGTAETDHDNRTPDLVNDLDIRLMAPGGATLTPFLLDPLNPALNATTGDNIVDNVEQIIVAAPAAGAYTLTVDHKGSLTNGQQIYSLVTGGGTGAPPPDVDLRDRGAGFHALSPASVQAGQSIDVDADVENTGAAASGAFVARFYLSTDTTIDDSDTLLGEKAVISLGAGSVTAIDSTLAVPGATPSGSYYVGWKIDAANQVIETNETNNTAHISGQLTISSPPGTSSFFDVTFEEAKHVVGQAPATGGTDSPSQISYGTPEVVNFGGSKVLKLNAPLTGGSSSRETILFTVAENAGAYVVEFDLYPDNLVQAVSGSEFFKTTIRDNQEQNFFFQPSASGQNLRYFQSSPSHPNPPSLVGIIGTYANDQWYHCKIEVNTVAKTWIITVDGEQKLNGPIYLDSDVDEVIFDLLDADGAADAVLYLDNIKIMEPSAGPPPPPTNISATDGTFTDKTVVTWDAVSNADRYSVWRSDGIGIVKQFLGETAGTSFEDTTGVVNQIYRYWVRSISDTLGTSGFGGDDWGNSAVAPTAPTNVSATDGNHTNRVTVSWSFVTAATDYRIYRSTTDNSGTATEIGTVGPTNSYDDFSAVAGTSYYYWIRAENGAGLSGFSASDDGFRLAPPIQVSNVAASDGTSAAHVALSWMLTPYTGAYRIYRSTTPGFGDASLVQTINSLTTDSWNDTTAVAGQIYFYWVRGTNSAGDGPVSDPDFGFRLAAPAAPVNLAASDGAFPDRTALTWDAAAMATSYEVYRSATDDSGTAAFLTSTTETFFDDGSGTIGQVYHYWIKAVNAAGTSPYSASNSGFRLAPPAAPANVSATDNAAQNTVTVNWSASPLTDSYRIFRNTIDDPGGATEIGATTATTFDDATADPGEAYFYWVRGENGAGIGAISASDAGQRALVRPDLHIGKKPAAKIGDDAYSDTGINQRIRQISKKRKKLHYYFCVENDGTLADLLDLAGTRGNRLFKALYRDETGANVTAAVVAGTFQADLAPAEDSGLKLEVKPGKPAVGKRKRRTFVIRVVSTEDDRESDAGQALAETKKEKKRR